MADTPDFALLLDVRVRARFPGYPHSLALLPDGLTVADLEGGAGRVSAVFLIDPDCAADVLNGRALAAYLDRRHVVKVHAQRARDLRPFLRRRDALQRRGYSVEPIS